MLCAWNSVRVSFVEARGCCCREPKCVSCTQVFEQRVSAQMMRAVSFSTDDEGGETPMSSAGPCSICAGACCLAALLAAEDRHEQITHSRVYSIVYLYLPVQPNHMSTLRTGHANTNILVACRPLAIKPGHTAPLPCPPLECCWRRYVHRSPSGSVNISPRQLCCDPLPRG